MRRIKHIFLSATFWTAIGSIAAVAAVVVSFFPVGTDGEKAIQRELTPDKSKLQSYPHKDDVILAIGSAAIVSLTGDIIVFVSYDRGSEVGSDTFSGSSATISVNYGAPFSISFPDIFPLPGRENCYAQNNSGSVKDESTKIELRIFCRG